MPDEPRQNPTPPASPGNSNGPAARQNRPPRRDPRERNRPVPDNSPESEIPQLHPSADIPEPREDTPNLDMPNPNTPGETSPGAAAGLPSTFEADAATLRASPVGHPNAVTDNQRQLTPEEALRAHRDPLTGTPGAHPLGVGIGAAAGGAAAGFATGAVVASVAGPIGTALGGAVGTAIGAIAGGLAGKGIAESINPTSENAYWRDNYLSRPYVDEDASYDEYQAAYQYGWEARAQHPDQTWDAAEPDLRARWEKNPHAGLAWDKARHAIRDAWERVSRISPPRNPGE